MCDFPNVENNDFELEALSEFCEEWNRRIVFLDQLYGQGHTDESLILCCCYIEAVGNWLYNSEINGGEAFTKALLRHGENEAFGRINPGRLLDMLHRSEDAAQWEAVMSKLAPVFACFLDRFYPSEKIIKACRCALSSEEFASLDKVLWVGTLAGLAHKITKCEGVHHGCISIWGCGETVLDFHLFYPALRRIFEKARRLIMSGKLRIY